MSDAISALNHARHDGLARIEECGLQGMITLRGDLGSDAVAAAVKAATGHTVPALRRADVAGDTGVCWMSPDELLLLVPHAEVSQRLAAAQAAMGQAHGLLVDVSDARALFRVSGPAAREVMAKLSPVDFAPGQFVPGQFRRSRLAQVAAAMWMQPDESFGVICFRSVAQYAFDTLRVAAQSGSGVGAF